MEETRVALLGIVVENPDSVEPLNRLLQLNYKFKQFNKNKPEEKPNAAPAAAPKEAKK